ncbi:hypothetical protein M407DRAFT_17198 [Tulasnella calospora MUT 4182]|uniref:Uncharacterized protein n=1 Tax=Tulasnella calospora MUT 4182 TaxID=1051891 RepID=A0A0C3QW28_9AGAM|nr:hypothetical protein M407DRAFT_17198 [Tulasnella calospora MUT 4182]
MSSDWSDGSTILAPADVQRFQSETTTAQLKQTSETDPELTPRAWWRANEDKTVYWGTDESVNSGDRTYILKSSSMANHHNLHLNLDFVGRFKPLPVSLAAVLSEGLITTPTLHVIGKNDVIVGALRSQI